MNHKRLMFSCLIAFCMVLGAFSIALAEYNLSLQATSDGSEEKTQFVQGDDLYLNILVNDAAGVAGCAFTLNYPTGVLTAPATNADGTPVTPGEITSIFPFTYNSTDTHRENSSEPGKIYFSGAAIDTDDSDGVVGGALYDSGADVVLFTVKFTVKTDAPIEPFQFSLTQTELFNLDAGYGTDNNGNGTYDEGDEKDKVPVLVDAVAQGEPGYDNFNCDNPPCAFPILLGDQTEPLDTLLLSMEDSDTDQDGLMDSVETNTGVYNGPTDTGTDPNNDDTDGDGLKDGEEVNTYNTNPTEGDTDGDGYDDGQEITNSTNPLVADAPGGTGYDPDSDTRTYDISGFISYSGSQTGTLYVKVYDNVEMTSEIASTSFATPSFPQPYEFTELAAEATYYLLAFIDGAGETTGEADPEETKGTLEVAVALDMSGSDITLSEGPFQIVSTDPSDPKAGAGATFGIDVNYTTSDNNANLTGLGLRIHYDSTKLTWIDFTNVLATAKTGEDSDPVDDTEDFDNDASTDKYLQVAWADVAANWPGEELPVRLYAVNFTVADGLEEGETSSIRFTASSSAVTHTFYGAPAEFEVRSFNCDIDGNGGPDALTDGLLIIRYLFGFRGETLISNAVAPDCTQCSAAGIEEFLGDGTSMLDVDGNGGPDALTDGLLIIRYLFGFRGETLISNAVAPDCTRCTAADIEGYLQQLMP